MAWRKSKGPVVSVPDQVRVTDRAAELLGDGLDAAVREHFNDPDHTLQGELLSELSGARLTGHQDGRVWVLTDGGETVVFSPEDYEGAVQDLYDGAAVYRRVAA
jgi:hypothetical protein